MPPELTTRENCRFIPVFQTDVYMPTTRKPQQADTRQRLIDAAGAIFAEHGFQTATIREICQRAEANVAAVNYYFYGKQDLYTAVCEHWAHLALQKYPPTLGLGESPTPEERLRAFIRSFLYRLLDQGRPAWHGKLLAREMANPTTALDKLIHDVYRPLFDLLADTVRLLLGPGADDEQVRLCTRSIMGQCLFYHHARPVVQRMSPELTFAPADIERLAEHITAFSLGAIKQLTDTRISE